MSRMVAAAAAIAFAAGIFVAAAPSVMGHGPDADLDDWAMWAEGRTHPTAEACEESDMLDHMSDVDDHMSDVDDHRSGGIGDWMAEMMFGSRPDR